MRSNVETLHALRGLSSLLQKTYGVWFLSDLDTMIDFLAVHLLIQFYIEHWPLNVIWYIVLILNVLPIFMASGLFFFKYWIQNK